jgi:hypothetical protein
MAQSGVDKIPSGPKLDALTTEKVLGVEKRSSAEGWFLTYSLGEFLC